MIAIFIYFVVELAQSPDPITYKDRPYPNEVYGNFFLLLFATHIFTVIPHQLLITVAGWIIFAFGVLQIPGWAIYAVYKQKGATLLEVGHSNINWRDGMVKLIFFFIKTENTKCRQTIAQLGSVRLRNQQKISTATADRGGET